MSPAEKQLFDEARRVVIGLSGARLREDVEDGAMLYDAYLSEARALKVGRGKAWALLASASQSWVTQLVHRLASVEGLDESEILLDMAGTESRQAADRG